MNKNNVRDNINEQANEGSILVSGFYSIYRTFKIDL